MHLTPLSVPPEKTIGKTASGGSVPSKDEWHRMELKGSGYDACKVMSPVTTQPSSAHGSTLGDGPAPSSAALPVQVNLNEPYPLSAPAGRLSQGEEILAGQQPPVETGLSKGSGDLTTRWSRDHTAHVPRERVQPLLGGWLDGATSLPRRNGHARRSYDDQYRGMRKNAHAGSTTSLTSLKGVSSCGDLAKFHKVGKLLFLAAQGNLARFQQVLAKMEDVDISNDSTCDYDKRTPLHVAADSGSYAVAEWLIEQNAPVNALDRFDLTPLACACRCEHREIIKLLQKAGGLLIGPEGNMVTLSQSPPNHKINALVADALNETWENWQIAPETIKEEKLLGEGQFGTVHLARWQGTPVVVKKLKADLETPTALAEFRVEMAVQHKLHHPNVVQFFGVVLLESPVRLVVEFMSAGSLEQQFASPTAWTFRRATEVCLDIVRGLWYLHALSPNRVIHRDLKPANLLLSSSGQCKVADFGISRSVRFNKVNKVAGTVTSPINGTSTGLGEVAIPLSRKTSTKEVYELTGETGSYRYMAPEVYQHQPYGSAVDVYSFAMIAFQCYLWKRPYEDLDGIQACQAAVTGLRPHIVKNDMPGEVADVMQKSWANDPDERPTCEEIAEVLEELLSGMAPAPSPGAQPSCACSIQ